jgi:membrane-associated protease RseP (regulator of RpoE activity)
MIEIIILFSIIFFSILAHEFGHYIVARLCNVKVEAFSLGFGKVLFHRKVFGTDWRLSLLPLGGYNQLNGEKTKTKNGFLNQKYHIKFLILIAGVMTNMLIACICYCINYKSILTGIRIDLDFLRAVFMKDVTSQYMTIIMLKPNLFLFSTSIINLFCAITNILPIPALDGGHIVWVWLEKILKKNFVKIYAIINHWSFIILTWLQILFVIYYWAV